MLRWKLGGKANAEGKYAQMGKKRLTWAKE